MDIENGELFFGHKAEESWGLEGPFSCSDVIYAGSEKPLDECTVDPQSGLNDSEPEDVLYAINPNDVFPTRDPVETSSESDSGISEEPCSKSPLTATVDPSQVPTTIYQVVYDISTLANIKTEPEQHSVDVISIELDEWSSQMLISESCIVNELPLVSAGRFDHGHLSTLSGSTSGPTSPDSPLLYPDLTLTEEEQKLLNQEGISLPNNLPLTKAEERILKKVRRKIRNKQSAQDSRRRKKDYVDGLESRAAACSVQNKELQRTVEQLEKHNMSLLAQLRRLQSLIKQTVTKAAQTSTCVMIIIFSLGLIIFPSYSPFHWGASSIEEDYTPKGVISRNILTDPASSLQAAEDVDNRIIQPDSLPVSRDLSQSDPPDASIILKQPIESPKITDIEGVALEESQPGNSSTLVDGLTEPLALVSATGKGSASLDPTKPAHTDEM
ncbi:cyclic AMP-responsive element-binding protein 3-like protein 4 isoform X1 [Salvelinus namaycush]|uniref:Cyclic AMP-responsive element-binding protein 3-like protein 4 n=1 Tax=Salvelinus namaycush TaxID=8040 RepID=A0A8U0UF35_SALNM|nr:cyclic AMP-responsive element-binding protein 3-like protein 4 isoform X3 [Salvelinus alpinus]XP_038850383.1 cyclic AMP-responsive element-binding protein 3-like protein 4 isoform X1 [Salvelinus namaycush]